MTSRPSYAYGSPLISGGLDEMFDLPSSWWSFQPGRPFGKISLSIRLDGAVQPLFVVDVDLFPPSCPTAELVFQLDLATKKDRCAIWRHTGEEVDDPSAGRVDDRPKEDRPEEWFWTLWYRHYTEADPLSTTYLRHLRRNVRGTPSKAGELMEFLHVIFSPPRRQVIARLSTAITGNNVDDISASGPVCLKLFSMLDDYDARFCNWMHREVVLRALGLYDEMDDGSLLRTHSMFNEWQERLEFGVDDYRNLQAEQQQVFEGVQAGKLSTASSGLPRKPKVGRQPLPLPSVNTQQVEVEQPGSPHPSPARQTASPFTSELNTAASSTPSIYVLLSPKTNTYVQELAGERNGPPPLSPARKRTKARVIISENNPGVPSSPVLRTATSAGTLLSPFSTCERPLHAEIYYESCRPHARNLLTRLYEGFLLPSDINETYMPLAVKAITVEGSDARIEFEAWKRDIIVRWKLGAVAEDIAYPVLGIYMRPGAPPLFVSPWCSTGNITQYIAKRASEDSFDHPDAMLDLMIQLLRVVTDVHAAGIVHGNIKGNNVIVTPSGELRLCDFGAYRADRSDVSSDVLADEHAIILQKSESFMSPELRESGCPTMESDMWAVSCVCVEIYFARYGFLDVAILSSLPEETRPQTNVPIPDYVWDILEINWSVVPSDRLSAQTMSEHFMTLRSGPTSSRT